MKVKELLSDESKWTTKAFARTPDGTSVLANHPEACQWCLLGAIYKCYRDNPYPIYDKIYDETNGVGAVTFNDRASFQRVRELIEKLDI